MVDIDHFKRLNDRFGHDTGDEVLRAVADAIARTVRTDDFPIRYGGEEFLVVLRRADHDIAVAVAERLRRNVATVDLQRLHVTTPVTVSVGIAVEDPLHRPQRDGLAALITSADAALYRAKSAGRDRVIVA
jgi:diguanylate cyclase (GGDEF)-like protein